MPELPGRSACARALEMLYSGSNSEAKPKPKRCSSRLLGTMSQANQISRLARAASQHGPQRLKLRRALTAASACLPLPLAYAAVIVRWPSPAHRSSALTRSPRPLVVGARSYPRRSSLPRLFARRSRARSPFEGALALDRHHGLEDRISERAGIFAAAGGRTNAAHASGHRRRRRAGAQARAEAPRRVFECRASLVTARRCCSACLVWARSRCANCASWNRRSCKCSPCCSAPTTSSYSARLGQDLVKSADDPQVSTAARRFNQLVEDIAAHRMDRREVFERLGFARA